MSNFTRRIEDITDLARHTIGIMPRAVTPKTLPDELGHLHLAIMQLADITRMLGNASDQMVTSDGTVPIGKAFDGGRDSLRDISRMLIRASDAVEPLLEPARKLKRTVEGK
jgi:hypothetical protein